MKTISDLEEATCTKCGKIYRVGSYGLMKYLMFYKENGTDLICRKCMGLKIYTRESYLDKKYDVIYMNAYSALIEEREGIWRVAPVGYFQRVNEYEEMQNDHTSDIVTCEKGYMINKKVFNACFSCINCDTCMLNSDDDWIGEAIFNGVSCMRFDNGNSYRICGIFVEDKFGIWGERDFYFWSDKEKNEKA